VPRPATAGRDATAGTAAASTRGRAGGFTRGFAGALARGFAGADTAGTAGRAGTASLPASLRASLRASRTIQPWGAVKRDMCLAHNMMEPGPLSSGE
jgi:hypothetical protein